MKETAVEFLVEQLRQLAHNPNTHLGMGDIRVTQGTIDELEQQAKEMEKQQIINAYLDGNYDKGFGRCSEVKYYNTKFKK